METHFTIITIYKLTIIYINIWSLNYNCPSVALLVLKMVTLLPKYMFDKNKSFMDEGFNN